MKRTKDLVLMAMYIALYIALEYMMGFIPLLSMPNGGKIGISAIPLILASYHLGFGKGLIVIIASLLGRFALIKPPYFVSWLQIFIDYFAAYGFYALSGLMKDIKLRNIKLPISVVLANILRYFAHSLAGVMFFPSGDNLKAIWFGSLAYNLPYMFVTLVVTVLVVMMIKPRLERV